MQSETLRVLDIDCDEQVTLATWDEDWKEDEAYTNMDKTSMNIIPHFPHLTTLRIGICTLLGIFMRSATSGEKLIDWLPAGLEEFTLRGYKKGKTPLFDEQVTEVVEKRYERLKNLKLLEGVDECIPNRCDTDYGEEFDSSEGYILHGHSELYRHKG